MLNLPAQSLYNHICRNVFSVTVWNIGNTWFLLLPLATLFLDAAEKDLASDASSSVTEAEMWLNQIDGERPRSTYVSK